MKNLFVIVLLITFQNSIFHSIILGSDQNGSHKDLSLNIAQSGNGSYHMLRHVIGSGGVFGATNSSQLHWATAGQTITQGGSGPSHLLLSGFWNLPNFGQTDVDDIDHSGYPHAFKLFQNYPNPFNPQTVIQYDLPCACAVQIEIYNIFGQSIYSMNSTNQGPGREEVVWDAQDEFGIRIGTGIYFVRVTAFEAENILFQRTRKMLLVK